MLELEEALRRILAAVPQAVSERVPLEQAERRVLNEPVVSPVDLPLFDNSAMDGYAVRAADVANAKPGSPVRLRLAGKIAAGQSAKAQLSPGTCIRLFTGSVLPRGADAVVMQEDTQLAEGELDTVLILDTAKPWENVRLRGEDVKHGTRMLEAGQRLSVGALSLIRAVGMTHVNVGRIPLVGVVATGSELQEPGHPLQPGQIYESNRIGLAALVSRASSQPRVFPLVPDDAGETLAALKEAFAQCDAVVTSGGVSVGEMDLVKSAFEQLGGELQFWRVAIRPGRPFVFGRWREKLLFGLPGNPVSALVTFLLLVRPSLLQWQGATNLELPTHPALLAEQLANRGDRRHFVRVNVTTEGQVYSAGVQASHFLSSLAAANGLVDVPPRTTLAPGALVRVMRWD
jgi:molybdopterin molybdotransferase